MEMKCLLNFYHFVACTNIVSSFSTSVTEADAYMEHMILYRQSSRELFPNYADVPNDHLAMHNPDLLKFWGPLPGVGEFSGERFNGKLGKVKTNKRICEIGFFRDVIGAPTFFSR